MGPNLGQSSHVLEFEDHKWLFFDKLFSGSKKDLSYYLGAM
jgi:hypothetical protein